MFDRFSLIVDLSKLDKTGLKKKDGQYENDTIREMKRYKMIYLLFCIVLNNILVELGKCVAQN